MNINIKATNTELSPSMKTAVTDKLHVLEKFSREEYTYHVELAHRPHLHGEEWKVDIHISPENFYAEAHGQDFYEALDLAIPKLNQQMRREKDKKVSLRRKIGNMFKNFRQK